MVYFQNGEVQELGGYAPQTTNNRMEMQAAIAALEYVAKSGQTDDITLYTDSEYVKNGVTKWIKGWKKKGWKTSSGKAVLNQDLWEILDQLNSPAVTWQYVRGHSGNEGNERCDAIARAFSQQRTPNLRQVSLSKALATAAVTAQASDQASIAANLQVADTLVAEAADLELNHRVQSSYSDSSDYSDTFEIVSDSDSSDSTISAT